MQLLFSFPKYLFQWQVIYSDYLYILSSTFCTDVNQSHDKWQLYPSLQHALLEA